MGKRLTRAGLARDILWVYRNLDLEEPPGAPTSGATAMLKWARSGKGPKEHFFKMLARLLPREQELANSEKHLAAASAPHLAKLDKLIQQFEDEKNGGKPAPVGPAAPGVLALRPEHPRVPHEAKTVPAPRTRKRSGQRKSKASAA